MFTPTTNLPDFLMSSGTVAAISSTFCALAAVVAVDGPAPESLFLLLQPDNARAPAMPITPTTRHHPVSTVASFSRLHPGPSCPKLMAPIRVLYSR